MPSKRDPPLFLCTFCWLQFHPPSKPQSLGAEKRICCQGCYEQLLDLAICWVCGEIVVRGEDVVSLGWCFWHRGCLGCLICSQPININEDLLMLDEELPPSSAKTGNRMKDQMEEVRGGRLGRKRKAQAIELDEVPVCHACDAMLVETGAHRDEVGMFLAREHVGQRDGGLGKQRWKMLRGTGTSEAVDAEKQESSKARRMAREFESEVARSNSNSSKTVTPPRPKRRHTEDTRASYESHESTHSNLDSTYSSTLGRDGSNDVDPDEYEAYMPRMPQPPRELTPPPPNPIYVSVMDPINGPSFRPSPTKPIPKWMQMLPGSRSAPVSTSTSRQSSLDRQSGTHRRSGNGSGSIDSEMGELHPPEPQPSPSSDHPAPHSMVSSTSSLPTIPESLSPYGRRQKHVPSSTNDTVYFTPPEYPCDFLREAMEARKVTDAAGLKKVQKSLKKGSLMEPHRAFHRRTERTVTESRESDCLAHVAEGLEAVKLSIDTSPIQPVIAAGLAPAGRSNAEFLERYNPVRQEDERRSKERARSVRGSLERVRGRGSVRRVINRALDPRDLLGGSEWEKEEEGGSLSREEDRDKERLRRELKGIFRRPT